MTIIANCLRTDLEHAEDLAWIAASETGWFRAVDLIAGDAQGVTDTQVLLGHASELADRLDAGESLADICKNWTRVQSCLLRWVAERSRVQLLAA